MHSRCSKIFAEKKWIQADLRSLPPPGSSHIPPGETLTTRPEPSSLILSVCRPTSHLSTVPHSLESRLFLEMCATSPFSLSIFILYRLWRKLVLCKVKFLLFQVRLMFPCPVLVKLYIFWCNVHCVLL